MSRRPASRRRMSCEVLGRDRQRPRPLRRARRRARRAEIHIERAPRLRLLDGCGAANPGRGGRSRRAAREGRILPLEASGRRRLRFGRAARSRVSQQERVAGIVVDLRGNEGGLYAQAARIADAFVKDGTLVSMVAVGVGKRKNELALDDGTEPEVPVAVLVDHETASGAEIDRGLASRPGARGHPGSAHLWVRNGAGAVRHPVAARRPRRRRRAIEQARAEAHHRAVPDPRRRSDPAEGSGPGRRASGRDPRPRRSAHDLPDGAADAEAKRGDLRGGVGSDGHAGAGGASSDDARLSHPAPDLRADSTASPWGCRRRASRATISRPSPPRSWWRASGNRAARPPLPSRSRSSPRSRPVRTRGLPPLPPR